MRVLVQWARSRPQDWEAVDASAWDRLPVRAVPVEVGGRDDAPGWVNRLNVQGVDICGYDHYAVESLPGGGCRVTVWKDDPDDLASDVLGEFYARVIIFLPLAPDARFGGAYNTRQSQVVYSGPKLTQFYRDNLTENTEVRPWAEFVPPDSVITRHGIWMPDALMTAHDVCLSRHGWREWTEGVPAEEIVGGRLREQRTLGRYDKPKGTKTFGLRNTDLSNGAHVVTHENEMTRDAFGASETEDVVQAGGASTLGWVWATASGIGEPGVADWPSGTYRCQLDVSLVGVDQSYGLRAAGSATGHFARYAANGLSDLQTFAQTEALFTGGGLKLATTGTIDPSAGATGDRFECLVAITRAASHGNQTTTMRYSADAFADGPWSAAVNQTVTPSPVVAALSVVAPLVVKGAVSLLTGAVVAACVATTPVVSNVRTLTPTPVVAAMAATTPNVQRGALTLATNSVTAAMIATTPVVARGTITVAPSPVVAAMSAPTPTIVIGGTLIVTPSPVVAALTTPTPTVVKGAIALAPNPVVAAMAATIPAVVKGAITLAPSPVVATLATTTPTIIRGAIMVAPDVVVGVFGVPTPTVVRGTVTIAPPSLVATMIATTPVAFVGNAVTPGPVVAALTATTPKVLFDQTVAPAAVIVGMVVTAPSVIRGPVSVAPSPVVASLTVATPVIVRGTVTLTPAAVVLMLEVPAPAVARGPVTLAPAPVVAAMGAFSPNVAFDQALAPSPATFTVAATSPVVTITFPSSLTALVRVRPALGGTIEMRPALGGTIEMRPALGGTIEIKLEA